jgi:hypothetical protein
MVTTAAFFSALVRRRGEVAMPDRELGPTQSWAPLVTGGFCSHSESSTPQDPMNPLDSVGFVCFVCFPGPLRTTRPPEQAKDVPVSHPARRTGRTKAIATPTPHTQLPRAREKDCSCHKTI